MHQIRSRRCEHIWVVVCGSTWWTQEICYSACLGLAVSGSQRFLNCQGAVIYIHLSFVNGSYSSYLKVICSWFLMNYCVLLLMGAKGFSECCARGLCQRRSMELCHEDVWCNASECLATGWATWKISELETRLLENAKMLPDAFAAVEVWGRVMTWGLPTAMCCRNPGKVLLEHWQCCSLGAPKPTWTLLQMLIAVLSRLVTAGHTSGDPPQRHWVYWVIACAEDMLQRHHSILFQESILAVAEQK